MSLLRCSMKIPNIRIASKHVEIEIWDPDLPLAIATIKNIIGEIVLWRSLGEEPSQPYTVNRHEILKKFVDLFNEERFWEAHEALEPLWRVSGEKALHGLILTAASFVKIQEGRVREFELLAKRALKILDNVSKYMCIDVDKVKEDLRVAIETLSPFKIMCYV
ncbi:MAG: DUF309 domain-containing protein [Sulfolobales archaeon]